MSESATGEDYQANQEKGTQDWPVESNRDGKERTKGTREKRTCSNWRPWDFISTAEVAWRQSRGHVPGNGGCQSLHDSINRILPKFDPPPHATQEMDNDHILLNRVQGEWGGIRAKDGMFHVLPPPAKYRERGCEWCCRPGRSPPITTVRRRSSSWARRLVTEPTTGEWAQGTIHQESRGYALSHHRAGVPCPGLPTEVVRLVCHLAPSFLLAGRPRITIQEMHVFCALLCQP
jgi:hypothetical protein